MPRLLAQRRMRLRLIVLVATLVAAVSADGGAGHAWIVNGDGTANDNTSPTQRWAASLTSIGDGHMLLLGGYSFDNPDWATCSHFLHTAKLPFRETTTAGIHEDLWLLDTASGQWQKLADSTPVGPRFQHSVAFDVSSQTLVVFGGVSSVMCGAVGPSPSEALVSTLQHCGRNDVWRLQLDVEQDDPERRVLDGEWTLLHNHVGVCANTASTGMVFSSRIAVLSMLVTAQFAFPA